MHPVSAIVQPLTARLLRGLREQLARAQRRRTVDRSSGIRRKLERPVAAAEARPADSATVAGLYGWYCAVGSVSTSQGV